ncbi:Hypothetical predicted protein [Marmota monax]|uniref:Uncharacterized protein n=1 Tax=Marmota monax TaxID=9995 RepID=A0A5E4CJB2_MARMO|nr:Hypothetical predicted protein [Marmota monax]
MSGPINKMILQLESRLRRHWSYTRRPSVGRRLHPDTDTGRERNLVNRDYDVVITHTSEPLDSCDDF